MPRRRLTDNYAATHGRVSAEWPAGERLTSRRRGRGPGRPKPRSRAFNSLGAKARSPRRHARTGGSSGRAGTHRPSGLRPRAPPGRSGSRGASSSRLRSPLRPPLPSPAWRGPATPTPAGARKRPVLPLLGPERLPLRALSRLHFSVPNAAAASCHRPSSQHGGCSCLNASRGLRELAPH
ncbi:unnamed protein product [Pipistrellus nathusii]|uniref:Uncharacterized protein n=1 Tax=Pipistrellus nathusii TaxID=59473 RepID=A0ABN9ZXP8_PIPNA